MQQLLPPGQTLIYTEPGEAFFLQIKIGLIAGLILASPVVFSQVWLFIAPGLYSHEKKLAIPFVVMSSFFFVGGAAFSHYMVFPIIWRFFAGFQNDVVTFMPRVEPAFSHLPAADPGDGPGVPAADHRAVSGADGHDHAAVHDQELQVRGADHLRPRRPCCHRTPAASACWRWAARS